MTSDFDTLDRLMRERRSERSFLPDPISPAILEQILDLASSAPSASNRQAYRFMVVSRKQSLERMVSLVEARLGEPTSDTPLSESLLSDTRALAAYTKNFSVFGQAPCVVVVVFRANDLLRQAISGPGAPDELSRVREALSSAAAFIMQFLLAAHAMGLGACWMTGPCVAERELLELLEIPAGWRIAALLPVGHVATRSAAPGKRRIDQLRLREPPADLDGSTGAAATSLEQRGEGGCVSS